MTLDIRTLLVLCGLTTALMAAHLFFYWQTRRVFPGFGQWVLASVGVASIYLLLSLRGLAPDVITVVLSNALIAPVALLRWQGARIFLGLPPVPRAVWAWSLPLLAAVICLTYLHPHPALRNFVVSLPAAAAGLLTARDFITHRPPRERIHFLITGVSLLVFSGFMMVRAGAWLVMPSYSALSPVAFNTFFFMLAPLMEIAWNSGFVMLNTLRLEAELHALHASLQATVGQLEKSLSEVKALSGMLPICASCKKIRDDQGYWQQIEGYIQAHSEAEFSHGICPACADVLYPEFAKSRERN